MKPHRLLHSFVIFFTVLSLVGCDSDSLVILRNDDASNVHLLGPGEIEGPFNELTSGRGRQFYTSVGLTTFTAARAGQTLATKECNVPVSVTSEFTGGGDSSFSTSTLLVKWTGSQIVCEVITMGDPNPESAGGGTPGRAKPSALFPPFAP